MSFSVSSTRSAAARSETGALPTATLGRREIRLREQNVTADGCVTRLHTLTHTGVRASLHDPNTNSSNRQHKGKKENTGFCVMVELNANDLFWTEIRHFGMKTMENRNNDNIDHLIS